MASPQNLIPLSNIVQDFTGGGIHALPIKSTRSCGDPEFDRRINSLVEEWGVDEKTAGLISELIITALKLGRDKTPLADLKLFNRSLREMRAGSRVFAPYRDRRKVVVFGSARTDPGEEEFQAAEAFATRIRELGYMIITGGGGRNYGRGPEGGWEGVLFWIKYPAPV